MNFYMLFSLMLLVSCGSDKGQVDPTAVDDVVIEDSKLDDAFKDNEGEKKKDIPLKGDEGSEKTKAEDDSDNKEPVQDKKMEEPKVLLYPSISEAKAFPKMEVNVKVDKSYNLPMDVVIDRLWDLTKICKGCKYNMPSIVEAKEFPLDHSEKIIWQAISKKIWIVKLKSATFSQAKQYRSEDNSKIILDLTTLEPGLADKLKKKTGLS